MAHQANKQQASRIEASIAEGKANQAIEGLVVTAETESIARQMLGGLITPKEARMRVFALYSSRLRIPAS